MSYKITSSGQVSIPAGVRRRWQTSKVDVEDHGDYVVVRPVPEDPVAEEGRAEVLRMAAAGISFRPPPSGDEAERSKRVALVGTLLVVTVILIFVVVQLLRVD